jgi:CRP-like cAMP-binding protein
MAKRTSSPPFPVSAAADAPLIRIGAVIPTVRAIHANTALFRQGDRTFGIFHLVAGRIRLVRVTPDGVDVPMHTVRPGEFFAEASIFSQRYHCDAIALQDCTLLVYAKAALVNEFKRNTEELWTFAGQLAQRVQGLRTGLEVRQIRSARQRMLQALRLRCNPAGVWQVDGTLKQLAAEIGLTHEALYRALAALERDGAIRRTGGAITLRVAPG